MDSHTSQISRHRDKTSLLSRPDGEGCGSHPKDLSILLQAGEAVLIKLLPPSSVPPFSALLFDDKSLQIRFPLPAVSLLESTSISAGRKLGGWWREKGPACLLFLSALLWKTPSSFPHTPPTSQPLNPPKKLSVPYRGGTTGQQPCLQVPLLSLCCTSTAALTEAWLPTLWSRSYLAGFGNPSLCLVSLVLRLGAASCPYYLCCLHFLFLSFSWFNQFLMRSDN